MAAAVIALSWGMTTLLTFIAVTVDERFLREDRLERAWLPSSRNAAILAFGPLAIPVHFAKTRGSFASLRGVLGIVLGLGLGVLVMFAVLLVASLFTEATAWLFGLPTD